MNDDRKRRPLPEGWWIFPGAFVSVALIWGLLMLVPL